MVSGILSGKEARKLLKFTKGTRSNKWRREQPFLEDTYTVFLNFLKIMSTKFFEVKRMGAYLVCRRNKINLRALRKTAYIS